MILLIWHGCSVKSDDKKEFQEEVCQHEYIYPDSKLWAHRVNDTINAQHKKNIFAGLEVDVRYSPRSQEFYVGHDEKDTINKLTLKQWFEAIDDPEQICYWIDLKTLDEEYAEEIGNKLLELFSQYNIIEKAFVENPSWKGLKILKRKGLHVLLWVDNIIWSDLDSVSIIKSIRTKVQNLAPDAISCEYHMFPLLTDSFPDVNVHFWHTQIEQNEENIEHTRKMCRNKSVKVVLVDYDYPIKY